MLQATDRTPTPNSLLDPRMVSFGRIVLVSLTFPSSMGLWIMQLQRFTCRASLRRRQCARHAARQWRTAQAILVSPQCFQALHTSSTPWTPYCHCLDAHQHGPFAGYIKLQLPVYHIGYFKITHKALQCICKCCSRVLLPQEERLKYIRSAAVELARTSDCHLHQSLRLTFCASLVCAGNSGARRQTE